MTSKNPADMFVQKTDAQGRLLWVKHFPFKHWFYRWPTIAADSKGNVYVAGSFRDTVDFDPGQGVYNLISPPIPFEPLHDIYLLKLNTDGDFVWARNYNTIVQNSHTFLKTDKLDNVYLVADFDGKVDLNPGQDSLILEGENPQFHSTNSLMFLQKLNPSGNLVKGKNMGIHVDNFTVDSIGNYYIVNKNNFKYSLQKFDSSWNEVWADSALVDENHTPSFLAVDRDGNIYTSGRFCCMPVNPDEFGVGSYVRKQSAEGRILWERNTHSYFVEPQGLNVDKHGNAIAIGFFPSKVDFDPTEDSVIYSSQSKHGDFYIQKFDSAGTFGWAEMMKNFYMNLQTSVDESGNFYVSGFRGERGDYSDDFSKSPPPCTPFIMKWKSDVVITGFNSPNVKSSVANLYPNPTTGNIQVALENDKSGKVEVLNVYGNLIKSIPIAGGSAIAFDLEGPQGIYTVSVVTDKGRSSFKVVKE